MRMVMGKHWNDLDGLRGVLALAVVFLHFGLSSFLERTLGFPSLRLELVVDVFFILSGFVLTHSLRKGYVFLDFAIKRTMRLLPVYYVTTLVALLFVVEMPEYVWLELIIAGPLGSKPNQSIDNVTDAARVWSLVGDGRCMCLKALA
jgi:peptidoglycan/LPS O-acetylase OafA/YrhL